MEENEKKIENEQEKTEAAVQKVEVVPEKKTNVQMIQEDFDRNVTEKSAENVDGHVRINKAYFKQYLQICTNLYINYTVIDKVLDVTGAKAYVLSTPEYEFLPSFIQKAKDFTLFSHFIDMLEQAQAEAIELNDEDYYNKFFQYVDALEDLFGLDYRMFEGLRQIRLGIFAKTEEHRKFLHLRVGDLEDYFVNKEITEHSAAREIAGHQSFFNVDDAEMEESYLGRGIGEHAVPTMNKRQDLVNKFDYNARENEFFSIFEAQNIIECLKKDLAGIEYNPLGINHASAFFLANLGDTKRLKKLYETPAVKTGSVSVSEKTPEKEKYDLSEVPSKYEALWMKMFKPLSATLTSRFDYESEKYRDFWMPFYIENMALEISGLHDGKPTCQQIKEHLTKTMGSGSEWKKKHHLELSDEEITAALEHIPENYVFGQSNDENTELREQRYIGHCLDKIEQMILQKQMDNFVYDADELGIVPERHFKTYAQKVSRTPLYLGQMVKLLEEYPEVLGGSPEDWNEKFASQRIEAAEATGQFIVGKKTIKYSTRYEKVLLEQLALAVQDETLGNETRQRILKMMETIALEISQRNSWRIIRSQSTEKDVCIVRESAFQNLRNRSNDDVFESDTLHWKQNIYSLSHLIESIIDTIEKIDKNAYGRLSGTKARRTKHEQMYDAVQSLMDLDKYAQIEKNGKIIEGHGTGAVNERFKDDISYNDIETIGIVKPFMLDIKESELLHMILCVRKDIPDDHAEWTARNRIMKVQLMFYGKSTEDLLDIAEGCGIRDEAEKLKNENSDEDQAKEKIRNLILQAITNEVKAEGKNE